MEAAFLKKRNWSSRAIFEEVAGSGWVNPGIDTSFKEFFMADLVSEYDSVNLYNFLYPRRKDFSPYFVQYLDFWYADERNHADGFFELNRLIFGTGEVELVDTLKNRVGDFTGLEDILSSEFNLLLLFAYDEYVSVKTYKKDTFYEGFGHPGFNTWIKNLIADEAIHFGNAVKILKTFYADRLDQADSVLRRIASLEGEEYKNTFLFDHDGPHFLLEEDEVGGVIIEEILSILRKR
ncbi:hypothetical protein [Pseudomonas sp. HMWF021]|jgi:hypothetical protein|uniref:hypothetical protein n=1 Tax=Pseudomonas sp. HMWF021 TaxID=2056857 RepID=UPI0021140C30|nr:hypothetical protein [Pseudomonas sp. HMWF021]